MTESSPAPEEVKPASAAAKKPFAPILEDRNFAEVLKEHLGEVFLIANPESFEEGGLGHQIKAGWYKAKLLGIGNDYLIVLAEFHHGSGKKAVKEPVKQYIPISHIKRISIMRRERLIHI